MVARCDSMGECASIAPRRKSKKWREGESDHARVKVTKKYHANLLKQSYAHQMRPQFICIC